MANSESKKLTVDVIARIDKLEKGMAKASQVSKKRIGEIENRAKKMDGVLKRVGGNAFGGLARSATLALAPLLSIGAAIAGAKAGLSDFDAIGKSAKAGGLDAESYQELAYAMDLGGVNSEKFAKAMETFAKNTGLAAAGKGRLITQLKALNPELLANLQATTDQDKRLRLVADALDKEADASRKAAIASALFGEAGARMVEALKGGSAALEDTARKARDLGIIVSRDLIANAETMNDEFSTAQKVIDIQFKSALVNLAPWLISSAELVGDLANALSITVDQFRSIDDRTFVRPLQNQLADLYNKRFALIDEIKKVEENLSNIPDWNPLKGVFSGGLDDMRGQLDGMTTEAGRLLDRITELQGRGVNPSAPLTIPETPTLPGTGNGAAESALRHAEAVQKLISDLKFERDTLGETAIEQEILNTLRRAGVDSASEEGAAIRSLVTDLHQQRTAIESNAEAMAKFEDAASSAMQTFIDDMLEGKSASEAFGAVLKQFGGTLLSAGISGISGNLSKVLGFADGGYTGPGGKTQPAGIVHKGEYVFDQKATNRIGVANLESIASGAPLGPPGRVTTNTGSAGGASITYAPQIDARGADSAAVTRLERVLAKDRAEFKANVVGVMRGAKTGRVRV